MSLQDIDLARIRVEETRQYYRNESAIHRALAEKKNQTMGNSTGLINLIDLYIKAVKHPFNSKTLAM